MPAAFTANSNRREHITYAQEPGKSTSTHSQHAYIMSPKNRDANRSGSGQNGKNAQGPGKQPAPSLALAASPSSANGLVVTLTAVASDARTPTLSSSEQQAVDDLFSTMKQTLTTLGNTFDALGKQTVTVASISPRVAAAREVRSLLLHDRLKSLIPGTKLQRTGEQLRERQRRQEARVEELKKALSTNVKDQQELLNKKADELVAEFVGKEVPSRVEKEVISHPRSSPTVPQALSNPGRS